MSRRVQKILEGDIDTILSDHTCKVPPMLSSIDIDTNTPDLKVREQLIKDALERKPEAMRTLRIDYGLIKMWDPILQEEVEL